MIECFNLPALNKSTSIKSDFSLSLKITFQSIWLLQNTDKDICKYHEDFANSGWFSPRKLVWVVTRVKERLQSTSEIRKMTEAIPENNKVRSNDWC